MTSHAIIAAVQTAVVLVHPILSFDPDSEKNPKNPKNPPALVEEPEEPLPVIAEDVPPPRRPLPLPRLQSASGNALGFE